MENKLSLISDDVENKSNTIGIYDGNLVNIDNPNEYTTVLNDSSKFRPVHCSEVFNYLKHKNWLTLGNKYISTSEVDKGQEIASSDTKIKNISNFCVRELIARPTNRTSTYSIGKNKAGEIQDIVTSNNPYSVSSTGKNICNIDCGVLVVSKEGLSSSDKELIENKYKEISSDIGEDLDVEQNLVKELHKYCSSKDRLNAAFSTSTLDVIRYESDVYTNTANLNDYVYHSVYPGLSGLVQLCINFSKNGKIYSKQTTFKGFEYDENKKLIRNDFIQDLDPVTIEYIGGVIKIFPKDKTLDECIISKCSIIYGNNID